MARKRSAASVAATAASRTRWSSDWPERDGRGFEDAAADLAGRVLVAGVEAGEYVGHRDAAGAFEAVDVPDRAVQFVDDRGGRAGLLVQAVDVLGDQAGQPAPAFEVDQGEVTRVRLGGPGGRDQALLPGLDPDRAGGDVLIDVEHRLRGRILRPQPLWPPEVGDPGRGGDAGPGQYGDVLSVDHASILVPVQTSRSSRPTRRPSTARRAAGPRPRNRPSRTRAAPAG
jgi:hypothetical protein